MNEFLEIAKKAEKAFNEAVEADKRIWKLYDKMYLKAVKEAKKKARNNNQCQNLQSKR
jgi:hypothetical protein